MSNPIRGRLTRVRGGPKLFRNFGFFGWTNERDHCLSGQADMPAGHSVHKFAVGYFLTGG